MSTKGQHRGGVRTLDDMKDRCEEVGECWEWQRHINSANVPQINYMGQPQPARRLAWELANGPVPSGKSIKYTCGNFRCINPAHSKPMLPADILLANREGANEALRRARIAATKRRQMGVAPAVVAAVKSDSTTLARILAQDLGVSESLVYKLRKQARAMSPFGGLMRSAA